MQPKGQAVAQSRSNNMRGSEKEIQRAELERTVYELRTGLDAISLLDMARSLVNIMGVDAKYLAEEIINIMKK